MWSACSAMHQKFSKRPARRKTLRCRRRSGDFRLIDCVLVLEMPRYRSHLLVWMRPAFGRRPHFILLAFRLSKTCLTLMCCPPAISHSIQVFFFPLLIMALILVFSFLGQRKTANGSLNETKEFGRFDINWTIGVWRIWSISGFARWRSRWKKRATLLISLNVRFTVWCACTFTALWIHANGCIT